MKHGLREDCQDVIAKLADVPFPSQNLAVQDVSSLCDRILLALGVEVSTAPITSITRRAIS